MDIRLLLESIKKYLNDILVVSYSVRETIRTDFEDSIPLKVSYEGLVQWHFPAIIRSSCSLDMTMFPWDVQACDLKFGSWSYTTDAIDIAGDKYERNE